ncbi:MAG: hypothetical protein ABIV26_02880, partial [Candidatus Limnocylindrales bacterium]
MSPAALWRTYTEHAALMFSGGPNPIRTAGPGWALVTSGTAHVDTNQLAFFEPAGPREIGAGIAARLIAGVPTLAGLSSSLGD